MKPLFKPPNHCTALKGGVRIHSRMAFNALLLFVLPAFLLLSTTVASNEVGEKIEVKAVAPVKPPTLAPPYRPPVPAPPIKATTPPYKPPSPSPAPPTPQYKPPPPSPAPPTKAPTPPYKPPTTAPAPPTKAPTPPYKPPTKAPTPAPPVKPPTPPYKPPTTPAAPTPTPPYKPPSPPLPPVRTRKDCIPLCGERCKLHSRTKLCLRACITCCDRCKCVPPGTYGNREMCGKCYTDMTTHGNKPKCP